MTTANDTNTTETETSTDPFQGWQVIATITRAELLKTGEQIQIDPQLAAEAGFKWPVYMTSAAWESTIAAGGHEDPETGAWILPESQSITRRLWDVLTLTAYTAKTAGDRSIPSFDVRVYGADGTRRTRVRRLYLEAGPVDIDNPAPCITIMTHMDI